MGDGPNPAEDIVERLLVENEGLERALRIRIWNECKDGGMRDDDAYKRINREIETIKTEARAALNPTEQPK